VSNRIEIISRLRELSNSDDVALGLTSAMVELNRLLSDPATEARELAEIIERDPMLTSGVLRAANSASYGLVKRVNNVKQAVSVLGFAVIQQIFASTILERTMRTEDSEAWENLWKHSLGAAVAARELANYIDPRYADVMFTTGLLHDLGSFVIYRYLPGETDDILGILRKDPDRRLLVAEKEVLGLTHQDIGAFFAKEWNFPELIVECIRQHHFISDAAHKEWIAVIMLANNLVKGMELGWSENYLVEPMPNWVWGLIKLPEKDFGQLIQNVRNAFDSQLAFIH